MLGGAPYLDVGLDSQRPHQDRAYKHPIYVKGGEAHISIDDLVLENHVLIGIQ